jgi:outer membrane protein OmpA-like peptidoglycan-associated protein
MKVKPNPQNPEKSDSGSGSISDIETKENSNSIADDYSALRGLLVGPEQARIGLLEARLDSPETRAAELAAILPKAVRISIEKSGELKAAMVSVVEESLCSSIRRNPQIVVEALFPIIGSIIRKAVTTALNGMVESLSRVLEHSLSWESLKWRLEAMRTGKPFAEVALFHSLLYRVEQIFLIHKETGALLQSTTSVPGTHDKELISGMLTAIQDFVRESFSVNEEDELDTVTMGDLRVILERGPRAVLAAVVRGAPPETLHPRLQDTINEIHLLQEGELNRFHGDTQAFEKCLPMLEDCLRAEFRPRKQVRSRILYGITGILAICLSWWAFTALRSYSRWSAYLKALNSEPGIVVTDYGRQAGRYRVSGFRDPLSADPAELLKRVRLDPRDVDCNWRSYISLDTPLAEVRAKKIFNPPDTVSFRMEHGALRVTGVASHSWIVQARKISRAVLLEMSWNEKGLIDQDLNRFQLLKAKLEQVRLEFALSDAHLGAAQKRLLDRLLPDLRALLETGRALGEVTIKVVGHADPSGVAARNRVLSQERASHIVRYLASTGLPANPFVAVGGGESDSLSCRCASFQVELRQGPEVGVSNP